MERHFIYFENIFRRSQMEHGTRNKKLENLEAGFQTEIAADLNDRHWEIAWLLTNIKKETQATLTPQMLHYQKK